MLARFLLLTATVPALAAENDNAVLPFNKCEQYRVRYRHPAALPHAVVPTTEPPPTVARPLPDDAERWLSLDDAIRIALAGSEAIRVLTGSVAVSSGRTIYDPAIANTVVDQQRAAFDPFVDARNTWSQIEPPLAIVDPLDPLRTRIGGITTQNHNFALDASQSNLSGGTAQLRFSNDASQFSPGLFLLNPQNRYATELSYTQPLLRGRGVFANRVPIALARIDTERSFFQLNDSVQELVRDVIEAYWAVVFARTDVWARDIQVQQADEALQRSRARFRAEFADITETAQAEAALATFRANLISARANLLTREASLESILGIPPTASRKLVPTTPPTTEQIQFDWNEVVRVAEERRPDLIELKLILEADEQRVLLARNETQPNLDVVSLYRWNGLEGRMPDRSRIGTQGDQFTDWSLGVNFSVPLYLRAERASLRSARLVVARDRAVLDQGLETAIHILAGSFRNMDQFYMQYAAFGESRRAAKTNLEAQFAAYRVGQPVLYINVLQAISDWGNSVSQEAQALAQYNTELANLERQTGTILETHGVFFFEDRFCSLGPLWLTPRRGRLYPRDIRPSENVPSYPAGDGPSERLFDLENYPRRLPSTERPRRAYPPPENLPPVRPVPAPEDPSPP